MAMFEQVQAKMKHLEQENERFKLLFAGDQSDVQPPEHFMTPQKATAAAPQAETPTPWKQGWGDPWRTRPDLRTSYKSSSSPELTSNGDWQSQPWCKPASEA